MECMVDQQKETYVFHIQITIMVAKIWKKLPKYLMDNQSTTAYQINELLINLKHESNLLWELKCILYYSFAQW